MRGPASYGYIAAVVVALTCDLIIAATTRDTTLRVVEAAGIVAFAALLVAAVRSRRSGRVDRR